MDFGNNFCDEIYHRQQLLSWQILFCSFSDFVIARRCWQVWIVNCWPKNDNDLLLLVDQDSLNWSASWSWSQHSMVDRGRNIEEKYKQRSSCIKLLISASSDYDPWVHQHPIQMRWRPSSGLLAPGRAVDRDQKWWKAPIMRNWALNIFDYFCSEGSFLGAVDLIPLLSACAECVHQLEWLAGKVQLYMRAGDRKDITYQLVWVDVNRNINMASQR